MLNTSLLKLWGKTDREDPSRYHPLLFHMLDVAAVAGFVWDHCLTPQLRKRLECSLGPDACTRVVFLSGAHDLGKASPGFQKRVPELARNCGLRFSDNDLSRPHGFVSAHILKEAFSTRRISHVFPQIAGGHHGVFPQSAELPMGRDTLGDNDWKKARQALLEELANAVGVDLGQATQLGSEIADPAIVPILAGFISVVDWIGSNQDFFPCVAELGTPVEVSTADVLDQCAEAG